MGWVGGWRQTTGGRRLCATACAVQRYMSLTHSLVGRPGVTLQHYVEARRPDEQARPTDWCSRMSSGSDTTTPSSTGTSTDPGSERVIGSHSRSDTPHDAARKPMRDLRGLASPDRPQEEPNPAKERSHLQLVARIWVRESAFLCPDSPGTGAARSGTDFRRVEADDVARGAFDHPSAVLGR